MLAGLQTQDQGGAQKRCQKHEKPLSMRTSSYARSFSGRCALYAHTWLCPVSAPLATAVEVAEPVGQALHLIWREAQLIHHLDEAHPAERTLHQRWQAPSRTRQEKRRAAAGVECACSPTGACKLSAAHDCWCVPTLMLPLAGGMNRRRNAMLLIH